jgi:hypothetical protein
MEIRKVEPTTHVLLLIANCLKDVHLAASDENRKPDRVVDAAMSLFSHPDDSEVVGLFDDDGPPKCVIGLVRVVPGLKCDMVCKILDPSIWGVSAVRGVRNYIREFAAKNKLKRINTETADEKVSRMAKMLGFGVECVKNNNFRWNGKLYPTYIMGMEVGNV